MIKLLIVDDEPLVLVGISSMLNWSDLGIQVCGTAMNGEQALKLMEEHRPELVITDIKMPIMNGLDMIRISQERFTDPPAFIVLTSYEEFPLIKAAMKYEVVDYLIKLELNAAVLTESVSKALKRVLGSGRKNAGMVQDTNYFYDKFMIRLIHNLFENEGQFRLQARELKLDFSAPAYVLSLNTITGIDQEHPSEDKLYSLYFSTIQMAGNIARKYLNCYTAILDQKHFCLIFRVDSPEPSHWRDKIARVLEETFKMIRSYFGVSIRSSVGRSCTNPYMLFEGYQDARQIQAYSKPGVPVLFYDDVVKSSCALGSNTFNLGLFKNDIQNAFQSYDADAFSQTLNSIIALFRSNPASYLQAIDASCSLLYLSISLLPDSENALRKTFEAYPDNYLSIHRQTTIEQVLAWLEVFRKGLDHHLRTQHKYYRNHLIRNVQAYIDEHIESKLSLNEVASIFSISPNYLSVLFKKTTDIGFTEYITQRKISRAKAWMYEGKMKIYEIADRLGFENAFYFSKVFKKVEGCSPREFLQRI